MKVLDRPVWHHRAIRVETIAHYLQRYAAEIIARKKAALPGARLQGRTSRPRRTS